MTGQTILVDGGELVRLRRCPRRWPATTEFSWGLCRWSHPVIAVSAHRAVLRRGQGRMGHGGIRTGGNHGQAGLWDSARCVVTRRCRWRRRRRGPDRPPPGRPAKELGATEPRSQRAGGGERRRRADRRRARGEDLRVAGGRNRPVPEGVADVQRALLGAAAALPQVYAGAIYGEQPGDGSVLRFVGTVPSKAAALARATGLKIELTGGARYSEKALQTARCRSTTHWSSWATPGRRRDVDRR